MCGDFLLTDEETWEVLRNVFVAGEPGSQVLLREGRQIGRGPMSFFGLDLAVLLEKNGL